MNYYFKSYNNVEIGLLISNSNLSKNLLSESAAHLKIYTCGYDCTISNETIHIFNKRTTPAKIMKCKMASMLHKTYKSKSFNHDLGGLFFHQNFNDRSQIIHFLDKSTYKVVHNIFSNRLNIPN